MNAPDKLRPMGMHLDMPPEDYHAIDAMSASGMRALDRSAWHYKNRLPITPTRAMMSGNLVHCAQLEPDALAARYIVVPEEAPRKPSRTQWEAKKPSADSIAAMEWWTAFNKRAAGLTIVSADEYAIMQAQLAAIQENATLRALFARGHGEVSIFWTDKATGVYCKARPDWVVIDDDGATLIDLKSTADEHPDAFARSVAKMGYYRQASHYTAGFEAATGIRVKAFVFAAVTSSRPVLAVPYVLTDEAAQQGDAECRALLDFYAQCCRSNTWPAYGEGLQLLDLPKWAKPSPEVEISYE